MTENNPQRNKVGRAGTLFQEATIIFCAAPRSEFALTLDPTRAWIAVVSVYCGLFV